MKSDCPELRKAALEGDGTPPAAHARACVECAEHLRSTVHLAVLLRDLPYEPPDPAKVQEIRSTLLASGRGRRRRPTLRRLLPWVGLAAAAAALALFQLTGDPVIAAPFQRAQVQADPSARFSHTAGLPDRPEIVHLERGRIRLEVDPLGAHERFIVETADAEVEVRGTIFEVAAEKGRLVRVQVTRGAVEVRQHDRAPVLLRAGERWMRPRAPASIAAPVVGGPPAPPEPASPRPRPKRRAPVVEATSRLPAARTSSSARPPVPANERAFRDAWAAFASGDMAHAAELFQAAEAAAPEASLAEDACYGRALALQRAARKVEAIAEMRRFLGRYPDSVRADEVSIALGWMLLEAGQRSEARARFQQGAASPIARVRVSAERGLEALGGP